MRSAIESLSRRLVLLVAALVLVAGASTASCQQTPLPGTMLGTYKVTGQTTINSCGPGLDAPDPWVFDAQVSQDGSLIYWSWMDGSAPLSGPLSTPTTVTLTTSQTANVDATDAGAGPCDLARADEVQLTLASGSPPANLSGTISYTFTVPSGSTCTDQLTSSGGLYSALPCTISYTMTAARQ
jgi:hypothetical protein